MDFDNYDRDSTEAIFANVDYSKYASEPEDLEIIPVKNTTAFEQITVESLLRIWKMIFRIYSMTKNEEKLESSQILNYVKSELKYSKSWNFLGLEKKIFSCYQRLKGFIMHINANDLDEERKNTMKQYVVRAIAIVFKYPGKVQESWSNRIKKLLRSVIHSCDDKVTPRISKGRTLVLDESPTLIDIDALIAQLHGNSPTLVKERRVSRDTMNFSMQSLLKQVTDKPVVSDINKSLLNSIYKDSPQFKYFSSGTPTNASYLDSIQLAHKRPSILLENISSLDRLNSGHWEENIIERKQTRNRTGFEKRPISRNFRSKTKDLNGKNSIEEIPEKNDFEKSEQSENSGDSENPDAVEVLEEEDIISNELQELIGLNHIDEDFEVSLKLHKKNPVAASVFGRKGK